MNPDGLLGGRHRPSHSNRRVSDAEKQAARAARDERERQSIEQAIARHAVWLTAQANSTIPHPGDREAERQAATSAAAEQRLLQEVRQLRSPERAAGEPRPPLRFPLQAKDGST
jgi:hypothetical protein